MAVYTFIVVFIFVSGLFVPGFAEIKQSCRNVSYNVQNLHQTNYYCENKTSQNTESEVTASAFAKLQATVQSLQASLTRLQIDHANLFDEIRHLRRRSHVHIGQNYTSKGDKSIEIPTSCPENYTVAFRNSCYKIVTVKANWNEAERKCLADGANLVIIESTEENTFLRRHILSNVHLKNAVPGFWTYGNDIIEEGRWEWGFTGNNGNMTYSDWAGNRPNSGTYGNCLVLWIGYSLHWADIPCSWAYGYICEMIRSN